MKDIKKRKYCKTLVSNYGGGVVLAKVVKEGLPEEMAFKLKTE